MEVLWRSCGGPVEVLWHPHMSSPADNECKVASCTGGAQNWAALVGDVAPRLLLGPKKKKLGRSFTRDACGGTDAP